MSVVRNLIIRAGADFSNMRREMQRAQGDIEKFKIGMKASLAGIATAAASLGLGMVFKDAANDAIQVEAAMQQINRSMGESAQSFMDWAETSGVAFNLSKSAAVRYGAIYSNLMSTFSKDTAETEKRTVDLLQTSSVVASGTGRTIEDVMWRIRSGMLGNTEAIEDLGINVYVSMLQSTKAFRQFAGDKSWDQLDFQTQQLIRYYGILEQANKKFGTSVNANTGSALQQFQAALGNVKLSLGQAFLPILNIVLPILTRMANALNAVMSVIAQFSRALFGKEISTKKTDQQAVSVGGVGDAYKAAGEDAKEAAKAVAGFDEVNTLPEPKKAKDTGNPDDAGMGGMGGASGIMGDASALDDITASVQAAADKIKKIFKDWANDPNMKKLTDAWKDFKTALSELGVALDELVNSPAVQKFNKWILDLAEAKFISARTSDLKIATGLVEGWTGFFDILNGVVNLDWAKVKEGLGEWWSGMKKTSEGFINIFFPSFSWSAVQAWWDGWTGKLDKIWDGVVSGIYWNKIKDKILTAWDELKTETGPKWDAFKNKLSELWTATKDFIHWDDIKDKILSSWDTLKSESAIKWEAFKNGLGEYWKAAKDFVHWEDIKEAVLNSWTTMGEETSKWWGTFKTTLSGLWKTTKDFVHWDDIKAAVLKSWDDIKTEASGKFDLIKNEVSGAWKKIADLDFSGVKGSIDKVWAEIAKSTTTVWDGIVKGIKASINVVVDVVNSLIDKINGIKISIPKIDLPGLPSMGGGTIGLPSIPRLPRLARGGITDGETNMGNYVAGEAGAEMIVPLENTSFVDKLAGALGTAVMSAMQFGNQNKGSGDVTLQVDGITIARVLNPYLAKENGRIGGSMITVK